MAATSLMSVLAAWLLQPAHSCCLPPRGVPNEAVIISGRQLAQQIKQKVRQEVEEWAGERVRGQGVALCCPCVLSLLCGEQVEEGVGGSPPPASSLSCSPRSCSPRSGSRRPRVGLPGPAWPLHKRVGFQASPSQLPGTHHPPRGRGVSGRRRGLFDCGFQTHFPARFGRQAGFPF
uniref:Uncharacterized protein n=1 Tax=Papio anubis TaxID=9555 RepID=A0A8I5N1M5_PAPAN